MRRILCVLSLIFLIAMNAEAVELTASSAAKIDPRLVLLAQNPARFGPGLASSLSIMLGRSSERILVPVLVKGVASREQMEIAGARIGSRFGDITSARIPLERLGDLAALDEVVAIEAAYRLHHVIDVSVPECGGAAVHEATPSYEGNGVIVGFLDTGIDPLHDDFMDDTGGTRVLAIWDQWDSGPPPSGYDYGREWTRAEINAGQCTMSDMGAHGSHCAGIACGDGSSSSSGYIGMAPKSDILMLVNFGEEFFSYGYAPPWYETTSTVGSLDGLDWMNQKRLEAGKPLVISWSQGVSMGPHDGSTLFEQGVDNFVQATNIPVVAAAGNDQQSEWHSAGSVSAATPLTVSFTTGTPGSDYPMPVVLFEVWYALGDQMNIEILDPNGSATRIFGPDENAWPAAGYATSTGDTVFVYSCSDHPVSHKGYFFVYLSNMVSAVTQGQWEIRVSAANGLPESGMVDMWFERNQYAVRWLDHVSYEGLVGMPGSAKEVITVGAYNSKLEWTDVMGEVWSIDEQLGDIAGFSSNGPTADGRQKPDISAPGQIVASVLSGGAAPFYIEYMPSMVTQDSLHTFMQGTSMAAPHVAGAVALMLEKDPTLGYEEVREILRNTAREDQWTGSGWNGAFGFGKLDALAAVEAVAGSTGTTFDLVYDDGAPSASFIWFFPGQGAANRMTSPRYPATLVKVSYLISDISGAGHFSARVYDFDGAPGTELLNPINVTADSTDWVVVDLLPHHLTVNRDFAVAIFAEESSTPSFGVDFENNGRAWGFDGSSWASRDVTYFIRATVRTGLAAGEEPALAGFTAAVMGGDVLLDWRSLHGEDDTGLGWRVYRGVTPEACDMCLISQGMVREDSYRDCHVPVGVYYYWLEHISENDLGVLHGPVQAVVQENPFVLQLQGPQPCPCRAGARFSIYLPGTGMLSADLYDMAGRRLVTLVDQQTVGRGWREIMWQRKDARIRAGYYLCRFSWQSHEQSLDAVQPFVVLD